MKASTKFMGSGKGMSVAGKAVKAGRVVAGKDRKIGYLPFPVAKDWTRARDVPAPPAQSFRDWWKDNNEGGAR